MKKIFPIFIPVALVLSAGPAGAQYPVVDQTAIRSIEGVKNSIDVLIDQTEQIKVNTDRMVSTLGTAADAAPIDISRWQQKLDGFRTANPAGPAPASVSEALTKIQATYYFPNNVIPEADRNRLYRLRADNLHREALNAYAVAQYAQAVLSDIQTELPQLASEASSQKALIGDARVQAKFKLIELARDEVQRQLLIANNRLNGAKAIFDDPRFDLPEAK